MVKKGKTQIWHGDLLLESIDKIPKRAKKLDTRILAMGEVTTHAHRLDGGSVCIYEEMDEPPTIFIEIVDPATLVHVDLVTEEKADHDPVEIPIGLFKLIRQMETDPFDRKLRMVLD